ncbi:S9 family peptidase [Actinacidiphila rubida]|uniref:Dipeptidyl-peptidase-4 n=1 Tax=Actinacidiphila rubida TaxID=310780 RepID=A0A1H8HBP1_9ACTN|nr:alpha/beta fold hydrolase [Actinacidiphila rubida]SEN53643.1 dipeptidyl-peptidase-4 [Actinacidiphila rubida]
MTYLSFPRQHARTQRFTLGVPRAFAVAPPEPGGAGRVAFVRARAGSGSPDGGGGAEHLLWVLDVPAGGSAADVPAERVAADPVALLGGADEELPPEERARRERSREGSAGIVAFAADRAVETAAFALSGRLFTAGLVPGAGGARELAVPGPVIDPRPSPDGRRIAYAARGALRVVAADGSGDRVVAEPDGDQVTWGLAEFVAAEEMGRSRGYWWSPDSTALLAARVDESPVQRWWIAEPAHPNRAPVEVAYPAAGTPNAEVSLSLFRLGDGAQEGDGADAAGRADRVDVVWDRARYPYLAAVHWSAGGPPLLLVQARDQREQRYLEVDTATGATSTLAVEEDRIWLDLFPGVPVRTPEGALVRITDEDGVRVLKVGDRTLTGPELHVRAVLDAGGAGAPGDPGVLVTASAGAAAGEPEIGEVHVYRVGASGAERVSTEPGVHGAVRSGELTVLTSVALDRPGALTRVLRGGTPVAEIASLADTPSLTARPRLLEAGERRIPTAVLLPTGYRESDGLLPVLLDPYGGPHGQRVYASHNAHLVSQWFADQGFAVIVADGRGTPGRSPEWEKSIAGDFAGVSVADQVEALEALSGYFPLDLDRVAIRGWSYGGYLAALAALRRPDVFHAAVVGAPVTDLRLYDTHYTERYLGHPDERPEVYDANAVVTSAGLQDAKEPARPMMVIHGLADDNVLVAHSLRLSTELLAAGRPHEVLPLSGVTHMTPQEQVAENLLLLQVDFLQRSLGLD